MTDEERAIDVEAVQQRLADKGLLDLDEKTPKSTRRTRSDAGKPRPKPPAPVEAGGTLTQEQAYKLVELADKVVRATEAHYEAIRNLNVTNAVRSAAVAEHLAFIDALAGGALVRP